MIRKLSVVVVMIAAACTFSASALAGPPATKDDPGDPVGGSLAGGFIPADSEWPWTTALRDTTPRWHARQPAELHRHAHNAEPRPHGDALCRPA